MAKDAGWYPDPGQGHELRYWDGTAWTEHVSDKGRQATDVLDESKVKNTGRFSGGLKSAAGVIADRTRSSYEQQLPTSPATSTADAIIQVESHESDRNSIVTLYPDRIERVKQRSRVSLSSAQQDAEVIPTRSVSSVQAKKDGLVYTKVIAYASGNTIEFRLRHDDAQQFKDALTKLVIGGSSPPQPSPVAAVAVDVADQLRKLAALRDQGILTEEEFAAQKAKLLG